MRKYHGKLTYYSLWSNSIQLNKSMKHGMENSYDNEEYNKKTNTNSLLNSLNDDLNEGWEVMEGEFVLVYVSNQTHLNSSCFFAPHARLDDGLMWMVVLKGDISRAQVLRFLISLEDGGHINLPYVHVIPIKAFRLEPTDGVMTIDGELIECGSIQAEILPSTVNVMCR